MRSIELTELERAVLREAAEDLAPYQKPGQTTRRDEIPEPVYWHVRGVMDGVAAAHGVDPAHSRFQVDATAGRLVVSD
jgi:hypothetical protein